MQTMTLQSEPDQPKRFKKNTRQLSNSKSIYTGELNGVKYYDYGFASRFSYQI